jgi:hypothetical protein
MCPPCTSKCCTQFLISLSSRELSAKWPWFPLCKTVERLEARLADHLDNPNGVLNDVPELHQRVHEHLCRAIRAVSQAIDQLRHTKLASYLVFVTKLRQFIRAQRARPAIEDSDSSEP